MKELLMEELFLSKKLFYCIFLGLLFIYYSAKKNFIHLKSVAKVGVISIGLFISFVISDMIFSLISKRIIFDIHPLIKIVKFKFNHDDENNILTCVACIFLSFSFHSYALSIFE